MTTSRAKPAVDAVPGMNSPPPIEAEKLIEALMELAEGIACGWSPTARDASEASTLIENARYALQHLSSQVEGLKGERDEAIRRLENLHLEPLVLIERGKRSSSSAERRVSPSDRTASPLSDGEDA